MAWTVELTKDAKASLDKAGAVNARRILKFLHGRVANLEDPRSMGESLKGSRFTGLWRYRAGAYRILCEIQDEKIHILVVLVGHRREVYK